MLGFRYLGIEYVTKAPTLAPNCKRKRYYYSKHWRCESSCKIHLELTQSIMKPSHV